MKRFLFIAVLLIATAPAFAGDIVTAYLYPTNAANINATNAYTITVNADTRTWTNAVVDASDEILATTNNATALIRLITHFASYPVADLTMLSDGSTYVAWRAAEGAALTATLNTNTWGYVSYTTNSVGATGTTVVIPYTFYSAVQQTNVANGLSAFLNLDANTTGISAAKLLSGTVPLARLSGITTNQIATAFHDWIASLSDTDDQTAAEVVVTPAGNIAANDVQEALEELDTEKQAALGFTAVNKAGDTMTGTLTVTGLTNSALTASRAVVTAADKSLASSATTATELGYVNGVTSAIQTQLDAKLASSAIDNTAYDATSWNGDTTHAPTKDAVRDKFEALIAGGGLGTSDIDTSAELRGIVTDEEGTGALIFAGGNIGAATATTPAADDNDTSVMTSAGLQTELTAYATDSVSFQSKDLTHASNTLPAEWGVAASDEITAITTGTGKITFRMPFAMTVTEVRASVTTAPTGSTIIIDINEGGVSILSTKLSIDASEKTSTSAASAAVISDSALADDAEMTVDFDQVGSTIAGAGVKILLKGTR
jgi:hypothetical protein